MSPKDQDYVKRWQTKPEKTPPLTLRFFEKDGSGNGAFPETPSPKGIPIIQSTTEIAKYKHYEIIVGNRSQMDAVALELVYILYKVAPSGRIITKADSIEIDTIPFSKAETFATKSLAFKKFKTKTATLSIDRLGGVSTGSKTSRSKERFSGIWARVYSSDGKVVADKKEFQEDLAKANPPWNVTRKQKNYPKLPKEIPLAKSFNELEQFFKMVKEKIKKDLKNLPKPPMTPLTPNNSSGNSLPNPPADPLKKLKKKLP